MDLRAMWILSVTASLSLIVACDERPAPFTPPSEELFPPTPENVRIFVGDGRVELRWDIRDSSDVRMYRIYRRRESDNRNTLIDSTNQRHFVDSKLSNSRLYFYQVSAVNAAGFEGKPSEEVSATPNIYDLVIENGDKYTNDTSVSLRFTVPEGTILMSLSNDSTFAGAFWEGFSSQRNWTLLDGDGEKTVYAKFRDQEGNETANPAKDSIVLDTKAVIVEVTEDTGGEVKIPGDFIHFKVVTNEAGGRATIDIGNEDSGIFRRGIVLYDDGTNGDRVAGDGTYEFDYPVPQGLQVITVPIVGRFVDRAGNVAPSVTATGLVTIERPPSAVTLLAPSPIESSPSSLDLSWTMNNDSDFTEYKLFRDDNIAVGLSSMLVARIASRTTISYRDAELEANTTYYYRVFVFDTFGLFSASNVASGTTSQNSPPLPVALSRPSVIDSATLRLTWSRSSEVDFASYRIYRSEFTPVDTTIAPIAILNDDPDVTQYDDRGLVENVIYYYRIFVFDRGGLFAGSNEVQGRITR